MFKNYLVLKLFFLFLSASAFSQFEVGFSKVKITPPLEDTWVDKNQDGIYDPKKGDYFIDKNKNGKFDAFWLAGFGNARPASAIHDDLWVIASVIQVNAKRIAFVAIDGIGFMYDEVVDVRKRLFREWKIEHLMISATHNHEGPDLTGKWGPQLLESGLNPHYMHFVKYQIGLALHTAIQNLQPAKFRSYQIDHLANPVVSDDRPPYVFDPGVRIMEFVNVFNEKPIGSIINFSDHPESLWNKNTLISADFPGYLRSGLENGINYGNKSFKNGLGGIALFINGAIGGMMSSPENLPIFDPYLKTVFTQPSFEKTRAIGYSVAGEIIDRHQQINEPFEMQPEIMVWSKKIKLPLDNWQFVLAILLNVVQRPSLIYDFGFFIETELNFFKMGDVQILTLPGELYPEIANGGVEAPAGGDFKGGIVETLPLRYFMKGKINMFWGLANDEIGYIIPRSQWDEKAPYTYQQKNAPYGEVNSVGPMTGPLIYKAALELMKEAQAPE